MNWRFSTFLLFLFSLLFGFTWATSQDGLCHSKFVLDVLAQKNKDGALNCFDFWLNRYQTLIAAFITLVTAGIAAYLVWEQLVANRTQARAAMLSTVIDRYRFWGDYLDTINPVYDKISDLPKMLRAVENAGTSAVSYGMWRGQKLSVLHSKIGYMLQTAEEVREAVRKLRIRESDRVAILSAVVKYEDFVEYANKNFMTSRDNELQEKENIEQINKRMRDVIETVDSAVEIIRLEVKQAQRGVEDSRILPPVA